MVSRRSTQSVTQRSTRQSELHMTRRPRRLVAPKTVDDAVGLSRKEERELKKALYASLQESRRPRTPQLEDDSTASDDIPKLRKSTRNIVSPLSYTSGVERSHTLSANMDESSQDSVMSSVASSHESKKKIHAQRKFAQGCSLLSTPNSSPGKKAGNSPHSLLDRVPKTEDFLTFLCLRGSHLLPANLDFFNFARDESSMDEGNSRPRTPMSSEQGGQSEQTRESTPESSSSGSNMNEELLEITTPVSRPFRLLQASRKAARASAGTPETARGIVSLRQGLTRKVVHSGATPPSRHSKKYFYTPEKTPSPSGSRLMFGEFTPAKKSASIKCLPASFLRFSPSGKLALERNGNSPSLTPYKASAASPLYASKTKESDINGQRQQQLNEMRKKNASLRLEQANTGEMNLVKDKCYNLWSETRQISDPTIRLSGKTENVRQIVGKRNISTSRMSEYALKRHKYFEDVHAKCHKYSEDVHAKCHKYSEDVPAKQTRLDSRKTDEKEVHCVILEQKPKACHSFSEVIPALASSNTISVNRHEQIGPTFIVEKACTRNGLAWRVARNSVSVFYDKLFKHMLTCRVSLLNDSSHVPRHSNMKTYGLSLLDDKSRYMHRHRYREQDRNDVGKETKPKRMGRGKLPQIDGVHRDDNLWYRGSREHMLNRSRSFCVPMVTSCRSEETHSSHGRDKTERIYERACTEASLWHPSTMKSQQPLTMSSYNIYVSRSLPDCVPEVRVAKTCICGQCHCDVYDISAAFIETDQESDQWRGHTEHSSAESGSKVFDLLIHVGEKAETHTPKCCGKSSHLKTVSRSNENGVLQTSEESQEEVFESRDVYQKNWKQAFSVTNSSLPAGASTASHAFGKPQCVGYSGNAASDPIRRLIALSEECTDVSSPSTLPVKSQDSVDTPVQSISSFPESFNQNVMNVVGDSSVTCPSCVSDSDSRVPSGQHAFSGQYRSLVLYPLPPPLCSVSTVPMKKVPTGTFKPVEPAQSRGRKDAVRWVLEDASKRLSKAQRPDIRRRTQKPQPSRDKSREDRAKHRNQRNIIKSRRDDKKKQSVSRKPTASTARASQVKPKRRSSMRLKTLAKILGRKRPNYSLVLSGYADMEEYEEEQKKKAAKSALAKAKAEARARASTKNIAAKKPRRPERMATRSVTATVKDCDGKKTDDKDRTVNAVRRSLGSYYTHRDAESKRMTDKERARPPMLRRSISSSSTGKDWEDKRQEGPRPNANPLKRSLSSSYMGRKDQPALASIIETKRLKRDAVKEGVNGKSGGRSCHSSVRESSRKSTPAATQQTKRATPKKPTPERTSNASSPEPGLSHLEKVPTFYPSEEDFMDPVLYIESIKEKAELYGMCRIVPPASWKMESKINEEIRFTTQVQHLHRLFSRWGPIVQQTQAIVHHLRDAMSTLNSCTPQIGGVEVDLPQLYHMIRDLGGLQNIVDKKQWVKVADAMKIPKTAHDRVTRLYDVYCKFVLPYAMLSEAEREQAQKDVLSHYELSTAEEEAILKGKSMTLGTFSRIARNVQSMWFKEDPNPEMVETAYWKIVEECKMHVSVQCAHVNTRTQSTAFPMRRESPYFRHSWNLNNLPDNRKCILKCLGPVSGTTIPTLHVGMLFSTSCWSTDPHRLPYVQYLHSGANTVWYCIPKSEGHKFHQAMKDLCPSLVHDQPLWLHEDVAMVNPDALVSKGVHVARCVQQPRQFVVVFPDVYTATVCCGYNVSESVHYATTEWLSVGIDAAKVLCNSGEKELFSVDTLVCGLCQDSSDLDTLSCALPMLQSIVARELEERRQLSHAGLKCERRLAVEDSPGTSASLARKRSHDLTEDSACEVCYRICYLSMVLNEHDEQILCLEHGLRHVQRKRHVKAAKLFYRYTEEELTELVQATKERVASLSAISGTGAKKRTLKKQDSKS